MECQILIYLIESKIIESKLQINQSNKISYNSLKYQLTKE